MLKSSAPSPKSHPADIDCSFVTCIFHIDGGVLKLNQPVAIERLQLAKVSLNWIWAPNEVILHQGRPTRYRGLASPIKQYYKLSDIF